MNPLPPSPLGLLVCRNLQREADAIVRSLAWTDAQVLVFPPICDTPSGAAEYLSTLTGSGARTFDRLAVFGCGCLDRLPESTIDGDWFRICRYDHCFEYVLGRTLGDSLIAQGAFLLLPGWLRQGAENRLLPGVRRLVLLDTGVDAEALPRLRAMAAEFDLPVEVLPVGLDHYRLVLQKAVLDWSLERSERVCSAELAARDAGQQVLRQSEQKYRSLFEHSPISLWEEDLSGAKEFLEELRRSGVTDPAAYFDANPHELAVCIGRVRILDVNRATLDLFQAESKEDLLQGLERVFTPESLQTFLQGLIALTGGTDHFEAEAVNQTLRGARRIFNMRVSVVPTHERNLEKVLVSLVDITERKLSEEALRQSQIRYRSLFEDSPISLWEEDFSEVKRYLEGLRSAGVTDIATWLEAHPEAVIECARLVRIQDINRATLEMFKAANKQELLHNLNLLFTEESWPLFRQELVALAGGATRFETEGVNRTMTGEKRIVNMRLSVVPGAEKSLDKIVVSLVDVTHQRELDRMKNEFISTAAHELRTPLASILGFSEVLLNPREFGIAGDGQSREFLAIIHEKAEALTRVVDELLDLSRIESGREIPLHLLPCDIVRTVEHVLPQFRQISPLHQFEISMNDLAAPLLLDEGKVVQVLENLLSNAVKYSPSGGRIRVVGEPADGFFRISVEDEGLGMTDEQTARAFDKFYRADHSDTAIQGLGLGLTIARSIVEAHGGWIRVTARIGEGTQVSFGLPLTGADGGAEQTEGSGPAGG